MTSAFTRLRPGVRVPQRPLTESLTRGTGSARLEADHSNLRHAIEHAVVDPGNAHWPYASPSPSRTTGGAFSRHQEAFRLIAPVPERPEALAGPELLGRALVTAAILGRRLDDPGTSEHPGERAVEIARQLDDDRLLTESLAVLSTACYLAGDFEGGFTFGKGSVARARVLGDDLVLGENLYVYLLCGYATDAETTEELFSEAIACIERSGHSFGLYCRPGEQCWLLRACGGKIRAARAHFQASVGAMQAIGAQCHHGVEGLGWVQREEGDREGARSMFEDALRMMRRSGDLPRNAYPSLGLACVAGDFGDWQQAGVLHGVGQAFSDITGEQ